MRLLWQQGMEVAPPARQQRRKVQGWTNTTTTTTTTNATRTETSQWFSSRLAVNTACLVVAVSLIFITHHPPPSPLLALRESCLPNSPLNHHSDTPSCHYRILLISHLPLCSLRNLLQRPSSRTILHTSWFPLRTRNRLI